MVKKDACIGDKYGWSEQLVKGPVCFFFPFRIRNLHSPSKKFKVEANANQLYLTGTVVLHKDVNIVVVEGGEREAADLQPAAFRTFPWDSDTKVSY